MQLAGFLGGIITETLGLQLDPEKLPDLNEWSGVAYAFGVASMRVALRLYLASMYAYDRLLMPVRFWSENTPKEPPHWLVRRPPSPALWILFQHILRIWNRFFIPATISVIIGLGALIIAPFLPKPQQALLATAIFALITIVSFLWYRSQRPTLKILLRTAQGRPR